MSYTRFFAMIATSTVLMFILMYLNTYVWTHVFFSETRVYMALLMGATMAIVMLGFMLAMYSRKAINAVIFLGAAAVFVLSLWLVRSQVTVGDVSYMRAMIPHHSIAIMTSERANISDPRVRKLADEIIAAQQKEIAEMEYLIADLTGAEVLERPETLDQEPAEPGSAERAIADPVLATLDPADLSADEIGRVLPAGAACRFLRTTRSDPILATGQSGDGADATGVMKLSGQLIPLDADARPSLPEGAAMRSEDVATLAPAETEVEDGSVEADLFFELQGGLTVGYRGIWHCDG